MKVKTCEVAESRSPLAPIRSLRSKAIRGLSGQGAENALLQAIICGYRTEIQQNAAYARFQSCGLAHLVAVSGAHLVIVTGFALSLLKLARVPKRISIGLLLGLMVAYTLVAGAPISCVRAAIMSSVGVLALLGKRRPSSLNALGIGLIAIIAQAPYASVSASLVLSALSTAGIVLFCPLFERILERISGGHVQALCASLAMTASASLLSQLYACSLFSLLPIVSPLANVVCAPLFTLCCGLGLLAGLAAVVGAPLALPLMIAAKASAHILMLAVGTLSSIPYASIPFFVSTIVGLAASVLAAAFAWAFWDQLLHASAKSALVGFAVVAMALIMASVPLHSECVAMLDVGQGDAFLLRSKGQSMLIDTGNQDQRLLEQLAKARVTHLNVVLLTHADDDHMGSLDALRQGVEVDLAIVAKGVQDNADNSCRRLFDEASLTAKDVQYVAAGDEFSIGAFSCLVVWPHELADNAGNADSVVLDVTYDPDGDSVPDTQLLFTGDAEIDELGAVIDEGEIGRVDILKVGHHGSRNAMTEEQLGYMNPSIALIGVGKDNRYGHPTEEIINMLDSAGCKTFRSDEDGGVLLELMGPKVIARPL